MKIKTSKTASSKQVSVPFFNYHFGNLVSATKSFWVAMGDLETSIISKKITDKKIEKPIYITGLARSGSTILLEVLNSHPSSSSHKYKDYPFLHIPYFWNRFLNLVSGNSTASERAHMDGIEVSPESPEAFEEILWMTFFKDIHDKENLNILDKNTINREFENFYNSHIQKLLTVRSKERYLAKGNYNFSRIEYIAKIHPGAKFIIPIREPKTHIASLIKQHNLFCELEADDPKILKHMQNVGHFEFGLDRRVVNLGNEEKINEIKSCWETGEEVKGWALYWDYCYSFILRLIENNPEINIKLIPYEDFCSDPQNLLKDIFSFCELENSGQLIEEWAQKIKSPSYYSYEYSEGELRRIENITKATWQKVLP